MRVSSRTTTLPCSRASVNFGGLVRSKRSCSFGLRPNSRRNRITDGLLLFRWARTTLKSVSAETGNVLRRPHGRMLPRLQPLAVHIPERGLRRIRLGVAPPPLEAKEHYLPGISWRCYRQFTFLHCLCRIVQCFAECLPLPGRDKRPGFRPRPPRPPPLPRPSPLAFAGLEYREFLPSGSG